MSQKGKGSAAKPGAAMSQDALLAEASRAVKENAFAMKRSLDEDKLMDALKHAVAMLSELRTSALQPKTYYELYIKVTDELSHLKTVLEDIFEKKGPISDLYELVQYTGNILPRLYLLITVGAVFIETNRVPAKDVLRDLVEMCRGVQHPLRGLFLRNYLLTTVKTLLPEEQTGEGGTIHDSVDFVLLNFAEMNKLWVRMQHQGHSRDRTRREKERLQLRLLVGTNLVRLSQLDNADVDMYKATVLPAVLEQVINCRDPIAQEYLMECIIQVFPDDYHLATLDKLLTACAPLHAQVNVKAIVISLVERLVQFFSQSRADAAATAGVPADVDLYKVFADNIRSLFQARTTMAPEDAVAIQLALMKLTIECYPENLDYVDEIFKNTIDHLKSVGLTTVEPRTAACEQLSLLLRLPLETYPSLTPALKLSSFGNVLSMFSYATRHALAVFTAKKIADSNFAVSTEAEADVVFGELLLPLLGEVEGQPKSFHQDGSFVEEQVVVARVLSLVQGVDLDTQAQILASLKKQLLAGTIHRMRYCVPAHVFKALQLAQGYSDARDDDELWEKKCSKLYSMVRTCVLALAEGELPMLALKLFLQAALVTSTTTFAKSETIAYEFCSQAFSLYEEEVSDSKEQVAAMTLMIGTLQRITCFTEENYTPLITKCALLSSKFVQKPDQCRGVCACANLFWSGKLADSDEELRDGDQVLKCLKKAIKVARSCLEPSTQASLYADIYDAYTSFYIRGCEQVTNTIKEGGGGGVEE
ncbi:vacuolar protein sorting-associated protein 35 [Salpingoeca rosetta]|uniref:Vacuolar protein sorting-associated protein 35 n=1 Tax=Salpingoeca rosetta (strain ATCC 50818 / BSB-021) TaxID=946362 RepID=F2UP25_SALR5|nr:vacuolar protein sorting-associated protein 35 [Salpingoeca rosetta]EGD79380.1 vacuolar protein sorting-associated protein 35 [Salpingoeca rosetta]|eukprot:XP_004989149.1 vacuolar protein sorting-associated protein 35 [Salpingoeca rosetta]